MRDVGAPWRRTVPVSRLEWSKSSFAHSRAGELRGVLFSASWSRRITSLALFHLVAAVAFGIELYNIVAAMGRLFWIERNLRKSS
jgi:hypothetical protein